MDTSRLSNLLGALALAISDALEDAAERTTHSATTMSALVSIDAHPGDTVDTLSRVLRLSPSGMSRAVDRLEQEGLVERRRGTDGRAVVLFSTDQGKQKVQEFLSHRQTILNPMLEDLSETEQMQLLGALTKMLSDLPNNQEHARNICRLCNETICHIEGCPVHQGLV
jgi:MarR family transcriptional regulator, negative regulator of the multidrug operon emrRAB